MRTPLGRGRYGERGKSVSLWTEGDRIVAQWRERGQRKKRSWANTVANRAEAKAWAERFTELRRDQSQVRPLTTRELWERYAEAEYPSLRPRSRKLYGEYWRRWEVFAAAESVAEDLGPETVARFRASLEERNLAPATIGQTIRIVKLVYAWGFRHRVLARNDVRDYRYKVAKERRTQSPAEYRGDDFRALLNAIPLGRSTTWRAHAVIALCGYQGVRQNAVLHLRWEDVDLGRGEITWRARYDKVGREWAQTIRMPTRRVLEAVRAKHLPGPWVFPAGSKKSRRAVYSAQSLWAALRKAERKAGIPHLDRRAAHGLRRMLFNDLLEKTGDIGTAMAGIGDGDLRVASRYVKRRDDRLAEAFKGMDEAYSTSTAPEPPPTPTSNPLTPTPTRTKMDAPRRNRTYNLADKGTGHEG